MYSVDLSAAFDLFRQDIFLEMYSEKLSHGLARTLHDFLTDRKVQCEVKGKTSSIKDMPIGCVQGSILGPRLFTLYMGRLGEALGDAEVVGYADDTYVIVSGDSLEDILTKTGRISSSHVQYLESLGMVVNKSKTEIVIFNKAPYQAIIVDFAGSSVTASTGMKALGVTLTHNLSWDTQIASAISKSQGKLSLLRKIQPVITMEQFLRIASSQIFSTLYYASTVWLNSTTTSRQTKRIESFHYWVLRVACRDFKARRQRSVIDSQCKRAPQKCGQNIPQRQWPLRSSGTVPQLVYMVSLNRT